MQKLIKYIEHIIYATIPVFTVLFCTHFLYKNAKHNNIININKTITENIA